MLKFSTKDCPKKRQIVLLSVVAIFGTALRFWNLGQWSFWIDEVFTVRDAQSLSLNNWQSIPNPIPYLAVKLSILIAGNSEWGSRLIPCIIGIASIPAVFGLGRTLFNWRVGLLSSTFVACASWHLFWAQNGTLSGLYLSVCGPDSVVLLSIYRTRFDTLDNRHTRLLLLSNSLAYAFGCNCSGVSCLCRDLSIRKFQ